MPKKSSEVLPQGDYDLTFVKAGYDKEDNLVARFVVDTGPFKGKQISDLIQREGKYPFKLLDPENFRKQRIRARVSHEKVESRKYVFVRYRIYVLGEPTEPAEYVLSPEKTKFVR